MFIDDGKNEINIQYNLYYVKKKKIVIMILSIFINEKRQVKKRKKKLSSKLFWWLNFDATEYCMLNPTTTVDENDILSYSILEPIQTI